MQRAYKDLIKLYADREFTGKSIALDNVSHSRIRELEILGETAEIGEGTKSPDNPFTLVSATNSSIIVNGQTVQTNVLLNSAGSVTDSYNPITGEYVQRVGNIVLKGTENWYVQNIIENTGRFNLNINVNPLVANSIIGNIFCTHYITMSYQHLMSFPDLGIAVNANVSNITVRTAQTNLDDFKSFLAAQYTAGTPVTVYYELAEPVTTIINKTELTANIPDTTISISEPNNLCTIRTILQTKGGIICMEK